MISAWVVPGTNSSALTLPIVRIGKLLLHDQNAERLLCCDTYYLGKYTAVASLNNPDKTKGAAIYILENDQVISTILPKEELGLTNFMHIHNAVLRQIGKKYYVIAQAWNPGDFAILEQVL